MTQPHSEKVILLLGLPHFQFSSLSSIGDAIMVLPYLPQKRAPLGRYDFSQHLRIAANLGVKRCLDRRHYLTKGTTTSSYFRAEFSPCGRNHFPQCPPTAPNFGKQCGLC